jgi:hypothetical protein
MAGCSVDVDVVLNGLARWCPATLPVLHLGICREVELTTAP